MNIRSILFILTGLLACTSVQASNEKLNVLACEPEWAALTYALGDESFKIYSATTYAQDPHHIQARPSLIAKARKADILVCSGAELEVGWLPVLLRKSGNPDIQPGTPGYFMATDYVELLDKRDKVDRSEGDVHGAGNPHIHFDPERMKSVAKALSQVLIEKLPEKKSLIESNLSAFLESIDETVLELDDEVSQLKGKQLVVQHDNWVYLFEWLEIDKVAELEPKPGLPPTTSHLTSLLDVVNKDSTDLIIYSSYQDPKAAKWMSSKTGVERLELLYSVKEWDDKHALQNFYKHIVTSINQAISSVDN